MHVEFHSPAMREIADPEPPLVQIVQGLIFGEGPVWNRREKRLYFVDIVGDKVLRWSPGVGTETVLAPSGHLNGMTLDDEGRLLIAGWSSRAIWRLEGDGSLVSIASHYEGKRISSPNDIVMRSDGTIYWTEMQNGLLIPGMDGDDAQRYLDWQGVFRLTADGVMTPMVKDFPGPNGLAFSPDESLIYVNDTPSAHIRVFPVDRAGNFGKGRLFHTLAGEEPGHADGMKVDSRGNVYCTGPVGLHVIAPDGTLLGRMHIPGVATNLAWGEDDWRGLFVTTRNAVFRTRLKIPGIPVGEGGGR
jgi:gluconolactonase